MANLSSHLSAQAYYLGIDYGSKQMGFAIGQGVTCTTKPLGVLKNHQGQLDWPKLNAWLEQWRIAAIVVGFPFNIDGTRAEITNEVEWFIETLQQKIPLAIYTCDERLTTFEAKQRWSEQYHSAPTKNQVDELAAQIILESWLRTNFIR